MLLVSVFLYGFLAACAALLIEGISLVILPSSLALLFWAIPLTAFIEEGSKWLFFRQFFIRFSSIFSYASSFRFGLFFGLGFFTVELGLLAFGLKALSLFPITGILLVHLLTSLFFALYLCRFNSRTLLHSWSLVLLMTFLHAAYNITIILL